MTALAICHRSIGKSSKTIPFHIVLFDQAPFAKLIKSILSTYDASNCAPFDRQIFNLHSRSRSLRRPSSSYRATVARRLFVLFWSDLLQTSQSRFSNSDVTMLFSLVVFSDPRLFQYALSKTGSRLSLQLRLSRFTTTRSRQSKLSIFFTVDLAEKNVDEEIWLS